MTTLLSYSKRTKSKEVDLGQLLLKSRRNYVVLTRRLLFFSALTPLLWLMTLGPASMNEIFFDASSRAEATVYIIGFTLLVGSYLFIAVCMFNAIFSGTSFRVHENGVLLNPGGAEKTRTWQHFTEYEQGWFTMKDQTGLVTIFSFGASSFSLPDSKWELPVAQNGAMEITQHIVENIAPRIAKQHLKRFRTGEELDYKKVKLSRAGLTFGKEQVSWRDLQSVDIHENGVINFHTSGRSKPIRINMKMMRMPEVFFIVLDKIMSHLQRRQV